MKRMIVTKEIDPKPLIRASMMMRSCGSAFTSFRTRRRRKSRNIARKDKLGRFNGSIKTAHAATMKKSKQFPDKKVEFKV